MKYATPRNPTGRNGWDAPVKRSPFEMAACHIERRSGLARDAWINRNHPLNERHYRLMCRIAGVQINKDPRRRAA